MIYYIKANISVKIRGISGVFNEVRSHIVHAEDPREAKNKFESSIRRDKASAGPESIKFDYTEIATEIF